MFDKVRKFFAGEDTLPIDPQSTEREKEFNLAAAVLLLEMAGQDTLDMSEIHTILATFERRFGLSKKEALELLETAEVARVNAGKIDQFVSAINVNTTIEQRRRLLAAIWAVVLADGKVDPRERKFMTQMRYRLLLSEEDLTQAMQEAKLFRDGR